MARVHVERHASGLDGGGEAERAAAGEYELVGARQQLDVEYDALRVVARSVQHVLLVEDDPARIAFADLALHVRLVGGHVPLDLNGRGRGRVRVVSLARAPLHAQRTLHHHLHVVVLEEVLAHLHADHEGVAEVLLVRELDAPPQVGLGQPVLVEERVRRLVADGEHGRLSLLAAVVGAIVGPERRRLDRLALHKAVLVELLVVARVGAQGEEVGHYRVVEGDRMLRVHARQLVDDHQVDVLLHRPVVLRRHYLPHLVLIPGHLAEASLVDAEGERSRLLDVHVNPRPVAHEERRVAEQRGHPRAQHGVEAVAVAVAVERVENDARRIKLAVDHELLQAFVSVQVARARAGCVDGVEAARGGGRVAETQQRAQIGVAQTRAVAGAARDQVRQARALECREHAEVGAAGHHDVIAGAEQLAVHDGQLERVVDEAARVERDHFVGVLARQLAAQLVRVGDEQPSNVSTTRLVSA